MRLPTASLAMIWETCTPAVLSLMNSASPISRFVKPRATIDSTSRSRAVSSGPIGGWRSVIENYLLLG